MALSKVILIAMLGLAAAFVPAVNWKTRFVGSYEVNSQGYTHLAMSWDENTAFAIDMYNFEVLILDTTDKHRPVELGVYAPGGEPCLSEVHLSSDENTLFVTTCNDDEGVHVVNVTDRTSPSKIDELWRCECHMPYMVLSPDNELAYVTDQDQDEIVIFNITDLKNPNIIETVSMSTPQGLDISPSGNTLYVADSNIGLVLIDVSDPDDASIDETWSGGSDARHVRISHDGDTAFVSDYSEGLIILDVSDPECSIDYLANWGFDQTGYVALSPDDNYAFVTDMGNGEGLTILDVSSPCDITAVGRYTANAENYYGVALGVVNEGRYVYVTDDSEGNGLIIIGLAMPCDSTFQWEWTYPRHKEYQTDLAVGINPLYVIMDIEDPINPFMREMLHNPMNAYMGS